MSEEKTEEPTQKKIDDARKKGQLPQRKNILEASILTLGVAYIASTWQIFAASLGGVFDVVLLGVHRGLIVAANDLFTAIQKALSYGLIFMLILAFFVLFLNLLLTKFNFAPEAMSPKFEKFNPVSGLKGLFSKSTFYNFVRMAIYFSCASLTLILMIQGNLGDVVDASACGLVCIANVFPPLMLKTVAIILLVLTLMAVADFKIQNAIFLSQTKMSKDEVKREHKGSEGDPMIKGARKRIAHEDSEMPTLKEVTHAVYSNSVIVAFIYEEGRAPFVVMKSKGGGVPRLLQKVRSAGAACVNLPSVASDFDRTASVGNYMDARSAKGIALILDRLKKQAESV